jgi:hypothetical protein
LIHQVESLRAVLEVAESGGATIRAFNPTCIEDELTDRWPRERSHQRIFIAELGQFAEKLHGLKRGLALPEMRRVLEDLFGEKPAGDSVRKYMDRHIRDNDAGSSFHIPGRGAVPALGSAAVPMTARATPKSTPFGD